MEKIEKEVTQAAREVLNNFTIKKLAIEELTFKFPQLSKSMLINAYAKVEIDLKKKLNIEIEKLTDTLNSEQIINVLMKKFGLINDIASKYYYNWKKYFMGKTMVIENEISQELEHNSTNKIDVTEQKQCMDPIVKIVQASKIEKVEGIVMKGLKVIEQKVIKTIKVEGGNGIYAATTGEGVVLTREGMSIGFNSIKELDEWVEEVKQVFKMVV